MTTTLPKFNPRAVETLQKRIATLQVNQAALGQEHAAASLKLAEAEGEASKEALQLLESIEIDAAQCERDIARLRGALAVAQQRQSTESRRQIAASLKQQFDAIDKMGDDFDKLVNHVVDTIEGLGPVLEQIESIARNRRAAASAIVSASSAGRAGNRWDSVAESADGRQRSGGCVAVAAAMWRSGLGRVGLFLETWVSWTEAPKDRNVSSVISHARGKEYMANDRARLRSALTRHLSSAVMSLEAKEPSQ